MPESPVPPSVAAFLPADLPSPLKALAGIAVTMVTDAKHLPERAIQLPGSVLTHLAAKSLKVQQQYAEWVARGEEFLGSLQDPPEEVPSWATFDEDLPAPAAAPFPGPGEPHDVPARLGLGPGSAFDLQADDDLPVVRRPTPHGDSTHATPDAERDEPAPPPGEKSPLAKAPATKSAAKKTPATKAPAKKTPAKKTPAKKSPATKSPATKSASPATVGEQGAAPTPLAVPPHKPDATPAPTPDAAPAPTPAPAPGPEATNGSEDGAPAAPTSLPDFDTLTIPQLRTRLKTLRTPELSELIEFEQAAQNRSAVIGMLRARLETLQT